MIVFPCKYDPRYPMIQKAVASAKKWMPHERILVVDSNSEDRSYVDEVFELGAESYQAGNENYETGAWWFAYENYPGEWFYYFVHDSCEFLHSMHWVKDYEVSTFMSLPGWSHAGQVHVDWGQKHIINSDYAFMVEGFSLCFGSMMFIQRSLLNKLHDKGFHKILPSDKIGSCSMERLWGIALAQEGFPTIPTITPFQWTDPRPLITKYLKKTWIHRT